MDRDGSKGGEELGVIEGGETVTRIYCPRKESIFNERGKLKHMALIPALKNQEPEDLYEFEASRCL